MLKVCFFGHRTIYKKEEVRERLFGCVYALIELGATEFRVGDKGSFDAIALKTCIKLKNKYKDIHILFVQSTFKRLKKDEFGFAEIDIYNEAESVFYEVEDEFYLNRIIKQNQLIVDDSEIVICYVDFSKKRSGAKRAVEYAIRKGKKVINLFEKEDDFLYGLSEEEKSRQFAEFLANNRQK